MAEKNWVPISKGFVDSLPKTRKFTELEAMYSLQVDYNNENTITVSGCSSRWGWSRSKVRKFFLDNDIEIVYDKDISNFKKQRGFIKRTLKEQQKDIKRTTKGHKTFIDFNSIDEQKDIKETLKEQQKDIKEDTTNEELKTKIKNNTKKTLKKSKQTISPVDDKQGFINQLPGSIIGVYEMSLILSVIDDLVDYCLSHNKTYTDYNATLRGFIKRDLKSNKAPQQNRFEKKPTTDCKDLVANMPINSGEPEKPVWDMEPEIKFINQG